jgi:ABC-type dipeptide/oligopeptide/nickel transport system permease component
MTRVAMLARRLLVGGAILLVASLLLFVALRVLPGDPAVLAVPPAATAEEVEEVRRAMGLDRSVPAQYAAWLAGVLSGDFGQSEHLGRPVAALLAASVPATVELALVAMALAAVLGLVGGVAMFVLRAEGGRAEGRAALSETGTTLLLSVPEFLWALLFILVFGVALEALPFTGRLDAEVARPVVSGFLLLDTLLVGDVAAFRSAVRHMVLPALALGVAVAPPVMRALRAALAEVYRSDYVRQARQRGLSETQVLLGHALRNAALPVLPVLGLQFGFLMGGSLLVEVIFAYPGMGGLMVEAVRNGDLAVIQGVGLVYCALVVVVGALLGGLGARLTAR